MSGVIDVAAEWAQDLQQVTGHPVLQAIQAGEAAMFEEYQRQSRYAACQSDPLRATDEYLQGIGADEYACFQQPLEPQETYRSRIFRGPAVVDPNDVVAVANAALAPYTAISCRYAERSDGWFFPNVQLDVWQANHAYLFGAVIAAAGFYQRQTQLSGTSGGSAPAFSTAPGTTVNDSGATWLCVGPATTSSPWSSHVFLASDGGGPNMVPNYPDRRYPGATLPAGTTALPNRRPPGAMVSSEPYGRWFLLRAPDISSVDSTIASVYPNVLDTWQGTTPYLFGAKIAPGNGLVYRQTQLSGTSGGGSPVFPTVVGQSVNDGTVTWTCLGPVQAVPVTTDGTTGFFVGRTSDGVTGNNPLNTTYIFAITSTVSDIYAALVGSVDAMLGQGTRWSLLVDPSLTS